MACHNNGIRFGKDGWYDEKRELNKGVKIYITITKCEVK
jgi:hypothetical protein